ncbi:bifunctional diaminohydroxyphosphoribosylaminopyrimidine deaminase/5-amino-6-(5-phosphoribosylamino)uracil reductase RibD [Thalassoglobus sp. JC818]|uniref:bifunctional diaminohydroxyphosphoribosylaminopyrimidine deaminase/5-amino-6-(5-phosphoribosylamino)uracil reductase RibD n=1 Tax=Thalassoglobus sp. JC818 TaxID=3232136 RepID=UPI0034588BFE
MHGTEDDGPSQSPQRFRTDSEAMTHALSLARRGLGYVEPNPPVGAVIVDSHGNLIGEGHHQRFGGPHAEVVALTSATSKVRGATIYVTLEPCSHYGKTPPCADALIAAGLSRVVIGTMDPAEHVCGQGIERLRDAGITVDVGVCEPEARQLIGPFKKLQCEKLPYIHAKWAMTLDGRIASRTKASKWISNEQSRSIVHQLRGRMDGVLTGIGTVLVDDPLLTARPQGPRVPTRIILDRQLRLPLESQLIRTVDQAPVLVFCTDQAETERIEQVRQLGVEVEIVAIDSNTDRIDVFAVLRELGRRQMTNVLIESGGTLLGSLIDQDCVDEVHCFIAPRIIGGEGAISPVLGNGFDTMEQARRLRNPEVQALDGDVYVRGELVRSP